MALDRRRFLTCAAAAPVAGAALADAACSGGAAGGAANAVLGGFLTPTEYRTLDAVFAVMIPSDADPGAVEARVVDYVDGLLAAFATDPPRIFAGGPLSGRHGGTPEFGHFLPLSRAQELAWRIRIEGSRGLPEREFNGPVVGWQQLYRDGLADLAARALAAHAAPFADLDLDVRSALLDASSKDWKRTLYQHTCEGMYGDPIYGGNADFRAWTFIHYEGDRQPLGYDHRAMSERDEDG